MKKFKNEFKNKFKDTDKGKDRDLDSAQDDPEAADSPDPGTDGKDGKKSSISTKVTSFLYVMFRKVATDEDTSQLTINEERMVSSPACNMARLK